MLEKLVRDKHSSLLGLSVSDEERMFHDIDKCFQCYNILTLMLRRSVLGKHFNA
jgi:hypothetical protein